MRQEPHLAVAVLPAATRVCHRYGAYRGVGLAPKPRLAPRPARQCSPPLADAIVVYSVQHPTHYDTQSKLGSHGYATRAVYSHTSGDPLSLSLNLNIITRPESATNRNMRSFVNSIVPAWNGSYHPSGSSFPAAMGPVASHKRLSN